MTLQTALVLALAVLCVLYLLRDALGSAFTGGCATGCGGCKSSGACPAKKLGTDLDRPSRRPA